MVLSRTSTDEYFRIFPNCHHPYCSRKYQEFNGSMKELAGIVLLDSKGKGRCGVLGSISENTSGGLNFSMPFRAPFGMVDYNGTVSLATARAFFNSLANEPFNNTDLALAPECQADRAQNIFIAGALAEGFANAPLYNFHFNLNDAAGFVVGLTPSARNHLNKATKATFELRICTLGTVAIPTYDDSEIIHRCYAVQAQNRQEKGRELALSEDYLRRISVLWPVDFFLLEKDGASIASAIVYRLSKSIAHLIYWGHIKRFDSIAPMYALAEKVYEFYRTKGFSILDIGPGTSPTEIDNGLCDFKLALGSRLSFKPVLSRKSL